MWLELPKSFFFGFSFNLGLYGRCILYFRKQLMKNWILNYIFCCFSSVSILMKMISALSKNHPNLDFSLGLGGMILCISLSSKSCIVNSNSVYWYFLFMWVISCWPLILAFHCGLDVGFATATGKRRDREGAVSVASTHSAYCCSSPKPSCHCYFLSACLHYWVPWWNC